MWLPLLAACTAPPGETSDGADVPVETGTPGSTGAAGATGDTGPAGPEGLPFSALDGSPPGIWERVEPVVTEFPFEVTADALTMTSDSGANQHLVRTGLEIAPDRPYRIEVTFTLTDDHDGVNSFAVLFAVGGSDGDGEAISSHAVNLGLDGAASEGSGTMRHMGFVAGDFEQVGSTPVDQVAAGTPYRLTVDVHTDADASHVPGLVTVVLAEADTGLERARFTADWSTHPWQPPPGAPVRFGLNGHGADWVASDLSLEWLD